LWLKWGFLRWSVPFSYHPPATTRGRDSRGTWTWSTTCQSCAWRPPRPGGTSSPVDPSVVATRIGRGQGATRGCSSRLALGASVTTGPIAYGAMTSFSVHMVQHIVLMMLATPLVVMGAPVLLLLRAASPQRRRTHIVPVLRSRAFALVTNPVLSWLAFAFVLVGIHFTPAMSTLMGLGSIGHYAEYALYSGVAFCFYYTLLPGNPARNRLDPALRVASLFLMMIPETMTGFFIYSAGFPLFPYFTAASGASTSQAVSDQQLGGALMWSTSMIIDVAWIAVAVHDWFDAEVVKTRRLDEQIRLEGLAGVPGGRS
jgi:cytochrome c oxidase assembly factor CtaG